LSPDGLAALGSEGKDEGAKERMKDEKKQRKGFAFQS